MYVIINFFLFIIQNVLNPGQARKESSWSLMKVRNYFNLIRNINPKMTPSCDRYANIVIVKSRFSFHVNTLTNLLPLLFFLIKLFSLKFLRKVFLIVQCSALKFCGLLNIFENVNECLF